jgi:hypothetical protein
MFIHQTHDTPQWHMHQNNTPRLRPILSSIPPAIPSRAPTPLVHRSSGPRRFEYCAYHSVLMFSVLHQVP